MLLAVSIGNTNTLFGFWQGEELRHRFSLPSHRERHEEEWRILLSAAKDTYSLHDTPITGIILTSVVPSLTGIITSVLQAVFPNLSPVLINSTSPLGLTVQYDRPATLGSDRFINAFAAWELYLKPYPERTHCLVIDCGTATTVNVVSAEGVFMGGAILPGIGISTEALLSKTAQLPHFELTDAPLIATNTLDALRAGILFGFTAQIDGLISRYKEALGGKVFTVGTGGALTTIQTHLKYLDITHSDLPLYGLRIAHTRLFPD